MMAQLLLSALFLGCGLLAFAVIGQSVKNALPQLRSLRAAIAAGDPVREVTWRIVTVEVTAQPAPAIASQVVALPVKRPAMPHQQAWRAAA